MSQPRTGPTAVAPRYLPLPQPASSTADTARQQASREMGAADSAFRV